MPSTNLRDRGLRAAVSGSFHRHMSAINTAVQDLMALSIRVLSPADPRVVSNQGEFLFVASDRNRSVRLVQDRHLDGIRAADFLWLVCPDGYVGQSAAMEIGFAAATGVPVFSTGPASDLTLREYITIVPTIVHAVQIVVAGSRPRHHAGVLINPRASIEEAHKTLEKVQLLLTSPSGDGDPAAEVNRELATLRTTLAVPTYMQ